MVLSEQGEGSDIQGRLAARLSGATGCPNDDVGERLHIFAVVKPYGCRSLCGVCPHTLSFPGRVDRPFACLQLILGLLYLVQVIQSGSTQALWHISCPQPQGEHGAHLPRSAQLREQGRPAQVRRLNNRGEDMVIARRTTLTSGGGRYRDIALLPVMGGGCCPAARPCCRSRSPKPH